MKTFLPISPQHEETREIVSGIGKHNYYPEISVFRKKKPWFSTGTVKFNVIWPTKICKPKINNWGKYLILFVTVLFIEEECLSLFALLKTGLSRQFCSAKLLQIGKIHSFQL